MAHDPEKNRKNQRDHYYRNKQYYLEKNARARIRKYEFLIEAKSVPCLDCGGSFPWYVMEFDHRDGVEKRISWTSSSWKRISEELSRCDVVCANCHRIRTHLRRN